MRDQGSGIGDWGAGKLWLALAAVAFAVVVIMVGGVILNAPQPQSNETALENGCVSTGEAAAKRSLESCGVPTAQTATVGRAVPRAPQSQEGEAMSSDDLGPNNDPQSEEEKLVDAFDNLTDKWQEPSAKGVTMSDIDNFARTFRKLPKDRRDECIHRALNLIPDENVMLLAGVLMDKSMDKETVETVYNDILNRDEDVKKPILQQIFKDKSHPCWADTAWILDVTGELPKAK